MPFRFTLAASIAAILCAAGSTTAQDSSARAGSGDRTDSLRSQLIAGRARNVILLIGDGMGDSEITIARNYHVGAAGRLSLDRLPLTGAYTTYAVEESDPSLPNYVTDSLQAAPAGRRDTRRATDAFRRSQAPPR